MSAITMASRIGLTTGAPKRSAPNTTVIPAISSTRLVNCRRCSGWLEACIAGLRSGRPDHDPRFSFRLYALAVEHRVNQTEERAVGRPAQGLAKGHDRPECRRRI